jgi:hypothetical protein
VSGRRSTVSSVFGRDHADALAAWAIDALCYPPVEIRTGSTRISATEIRRGRELLEAAGIPWRELTGERSGEAAR